MRHGLQPEVWHCQGLFWFFPKFTHVLHVEFLFSDRHFPSESPSKYPSVHYDKSKFIVVHPLLNTDIDVDCRGGSKGKAASRSMVARAWGVCSSRDHPSYAPPHGACPLPGHSELTPPKTETVCLLRFQFNSNLHLRFAFAVHQDA